MQSKMTGDDLKTPSATSFSADRVTSRRNESERVDISKRIFERDLKNILDEIAARSHRLRLKHPRNVAGYVNFAEANFPSRPRPVSEAIDHLLDEFARFEALLGEDPRLDHLRFSLLTLDSCVARLNYRQIDIDQSPGIEAIITRIDADITALDQQLRDEAGVTESAASDQDSPLDATIVRLSEAVLGLGDKVDQLAEGQEKIATQTENLAALKNTVAAMSAATLHQVGRQIAGFDTRFETLDLGLSRLGEQINAIHARLSEAARRPEPDGRKDDNSTSEELKSRIASLHTGMSKSGQQNFAAMAAVLAGNEKILERISQVEDSVKAELKSHEFRSRFPRLSPSHHPGSGNSSDPRAVIKAARAAVARAREEAGLMLDATQQKIGSKPLTNPIVA